MLLPHLKGKISFGTIVNQTALSANHVKTKLGFLRADTHPGELWKEQGSSAVLIATRHHLHAPMVIAALKANRHIFVEKPLCLTRQELSDIDLAWSQSKGSLQVGFNRRFSPATVQLKRLMMEAPGPKSITCRINAGKLDPKSWYSNLAESGGRILGEACHFFDLFCYLTGTAPVRVFAQPTWPTAGQTPFADSFAAQIEFADGSCGQLVYTAEGDTSYPKEMITVYGAGFVSEIDNFQALIVNRSRKQKRTSCSSKGHAEQMAAWVDFLAAKTVHPLPYEQSRQSMILTFAALDSMQQGKSVPCQ
jgi:predicted dehydrogenase